MLRKTTRRTPRDEAREVLRTCGARRAPVQVERIARKLGLDVKFEAADDDLSGALVRENGRALIGVNSRHHPNRQRFTIAHEIGHFRLHAPSEFHMDDDFARVVFRDKNSSLASDQEEIEANQFAAELLMPEDLLRSDLPKRRRIDPAVIESLAQRYAVSKQAMEIRLRNLGFLPPVDLW